MLSWFALWLTWLGGRVGAWVHWAVDHVNSLWGEVITWGVAWLTAVRDWLLTQMPPEVVSWLNQHPWESWYSYLDDVAWILPVYGALGIILTTYTLVGAVRLVRWVVGCIPTLNL